MTSDDERVGYLSGAMSDAELGADDRADLDELRALLADPAIWEDPPDELEDAVVEAVRREAGAVRHVAPTPLVPSRRRRLAPVLAAAAALAALVLAAVLVMGQDTERAQFAASLRATELVAGATGNATFTRTDSGWRVELDAEHLPRLDQGRFYQAWLRDDAGTLVAIGTFNEPNDVVLWAGVSPRDFPTLTVTEEAADDDPASSGRRVLTGSVSER